MNQADVFAYGACQLDLRAHSVFDSGFAFHNGELKGISRLDQAAHNFRLPFVKRVLNPAISEIIGKVQHLSSYFQNLSTNYCEANTNVFGKHYKRQNFVVSPSAVAFENFAVHSVINRLLSGRVIEEVFHGNLQRICNDLQSRCQCRGSKDGPVMCLPSRRPSVRSSQDDCADQGGNCTYRTSPCTNRAPSGGVELCPRHSFVCAKTSCCAQHHHRVDVVPRTKPLPDFRKHDSPVKFPADRITTTPTVTGAPV